MRWEPPVAKERDHDGLSEEEFQEQRREEAALLEVFSDSKVNKSLATVNISFFEGNPVSEFERIERWLSSNVPDRELDPIWGLVKPLTIVRIGDRIMRALMFACDDVLPQFDGMKSDRNFDEKDAWNNMVCNLAGFYHEVTGQEPTATESEADGCSPSEFVGLVYAVTQQFSLSRQKRWPGKERGGQQAIVKKGNGPPNAMAKAVKRALKPWKAERDKHTAVNAA
jgi:hypothetical protein